MVKIYHVKINIEESQDSHFYRHCRQHVAIFVEEEIRCEEEKGRLKM